MTEPERIEEAAADADAIEARAGAATPGPWGWRHFGGDLENALRVVVYPPSVDAWDVIADDIFEPANAEFIAAARTDVPALVAEVRRLRADIAAVIATKGDDWQTGYETGCEMSHSIGCDSIQGERDWLRTELARTEGDLGVAVREAARARGAMREIREHGKASCREWTVGEFNRCNRPAEFILWGKLFPPEALGPRCFDHAAQYTRTDLHTIEQSAIFDLRPLAALDQRLVPGETK